MFSHIKTSKENKEVVSLLTRKLNLGAENVIARVALSYSLAKDRKLDVKDIQNSSGKEYSKSVLFGDYFDYYIGIVALHYGIHISDKDLSKYVKLHIDDGLELLNKELSLNSHIEGFDYLINKIQVSIEKLV